MPIFLVKSHPYPPNLDTRVLEIEADAFSYNDHSGCFEFRTDSTLVAAVPSSGVFAVVEEDAEFDDYVGSSDPDDEGCPLEESLNSLVCPECGEIVSDEDEPAQQSAVTEAVPPSPEKATVEYRYYHGEPTLGVVYKSRFIPYFGVSDDLRRSLANLTAEIETMPDFGNFLTAPLSECPLAEPSNE